MSEKTAADYERSDIDPAVVGWIAMGLAIFVLAIPLVMPLLFPQSIYRGSPTARPALSADAPPLEVHPSDNLRHQREADGKFANTYDWNDREHKIVRIPVTRAIERLLQTGLPGWRSR